MNKWAGVWSRGSQIPAMAFSKAINYSSLLVFSARLQIQICFFFFPRQLIQRCCILTSQEARSSTSCKGLEDFIVLISALKTRSICFTQRFNQWRFTVLMMHQYLFANNMASASEKGEKFSQSRQTVWLEDMNVLYKLYVCVSCGVFCSCNESGFVLYWFVYCCVALVNHLQVFAFVHSRFKALLPYAQ